MLTTSPNSSRSSIQSRLSKANEGAHASAPRVQGDREYHSKPHEVELRRRNIEPVLAHRGTAHGSGLGTTRWVVERTVSWLHQYRRLRVRYERRVDIHEAFLTLGCVPICCKLALSVL